MIIPIKKMVLILCITMLSKNMISNLVKNIPVFELSYEENVDKKVYSDICFALPYGIKHLYWFVFVNGEHVCLSIPIQGNKLDITNSKVETCCFNKSICYGNGTLCLGVKVRNSNTVVLYDVYYYNNINYYSTDHYRKKIEILGKLLDNIKNNVVLSRQLSFFMPQFARNSTELYEKTRNEAYDVYCYMFAYLYVNDGGYNLFRRYVVTRTAHSSEAVFLIKPAETNMFDMYDLYASNKGKIDYYAKAHINTIKMSYILNNHFFEYKYIDNLDCAEDSDDDFDCDNSVNNKSNITVKNAYVKCVYNKYLKLWVPIELLKASGAIKICTMNEAKSLAI